ncbi:hypothetical protein ACI48J_21675 [Paenibacillus chitinolyticus]|uniref:hypothetical protein n=1 Tax=Paenibacillus chitinolyticus TaxID=79263 RepID=UPI002DBA7797|nr:hypothetical protein [Paenibacillus chitinolyticus]MEC0248504.1 hypothetical protein [Paenibacillus chitinolyticus]
MSEHFMPLDLKPYFNRKGATGEGSYGEGGITLRGLSYPEEEMPFGQPLTVSSVPFRLERTEAFDHLETTGQTCRFPPFKTGAVHILGVGSDGDMTTTLALMKGGEIVMEKSFGLTLHMAHEASFDNVCAIACSKSNMPSGPFPHIQLRLWAASVLLEEEADIDGIRFEDHPCIRIFAITLEGAERS